MLAKSITLSNLINDCVILARDAGRVVRATASHLALSTDTTKEDRKTEISQADFLIRQTYLHNLS